jgi:hypothetical protein
VALHATIVPDGLIAPGTWTIGGGAPSLVSAVADADDLTYAANTGGDRVLWFSVGNIPALSAGEVITHLRIRYRASMAAFVGGNITLYFSLGGGTEGTALGPLGTSIAEGDFTLESPPGGGDWTEAMVNAMAVAAVSWQTGETRLHRLWIEVHTNTPPDAVPLATDPVVVSTVAGPGEPVRNWAYFDADGDLQEQVHIKLFAGADAVADPETEVGRLVSDTGEFDYTGTAIGFNTWPNGPYIWAIKAKDVGGTFGPWAQRAITYDLPVPPPPLVTATPDPGLARYVVTLDDVAGTYPTEFFQIQRSENSGVTFRQFYGGDNVAFSGTPVTLWDYRSPRMARPYTPESFGAFGFNEAVGFNAEVGFNGAFTPSVGPLNVVRYRARAGRIYNGVTIWSGWTTITPDNLVGDGSMWLKHPFDPGKSILLQQLADWTTTSEEDMSILRSAHRQDFVVFAGVASWKRGEMELIFSSDAAYQAFENLRAPTTSYTALDANVGLITPAAPTAYLFQSCFGDTALEQVWMRLGPTLSTTRVTTGPSQHTNQYRRVKIGFVETRIPSP